MAFSIPTLTDVVERTRQAFKANLPTSDPWLWPSNVAISAKVIGERVWESFHRLDYLEDQAFPLTATGDFLDRHAQSYGLTRNAATAAQGEITGTGGTATTVIPAGTLLQNNDGVQYQTTAAATVDASGNVTFEVQAIEAGLDSNMVGGTSVFFLTAIGFRRCAL